MPFPASPSVGDTFTNANGTTFTWTSHGTWDAIGGSGGSTNLPPNANGFLRNDGTGALSWDASAGIGNWTDTSRPTTPTTGDTGYNVTLNRIEYWNGSNWEPVGSNVSAGATVPTNAQRGDLWFNTTNEIIYAYINDGTGDLWIDISSPSGGGVFQWTTATRPTSPNAGTIGFNTDTNVLELWDGTSWGAIGTSTPPLLSWTTATRPATPGVGERGFNTDLNVLEVWNGTSWGGVGSGTWSTASRPAVPTTGQVGYNSDTGALEYWNGSAWQAVGGSSVTASATAPASASLGDMWFNTSNDILFVRVNDGANDVWLDVSTIGAGGGGVNVSASATAPATPNLGDLWFNTTNDILFVRVSDGANDVWLDISTIGGGGGTGVNVVASATAPATPNLGDMWFNTTNDTLFIRVNDGASDVWLDVSSIGGGGSTTPLSWTTATRPATPTVGTTGFNTSLGLSEVWDGTAWVAIRGNVTASSTAPTSPHLGDMWFNTGNDILFIRVNDGANDVWLDVSSIGGGSSGPTYTTSATAPATPNVGDEWYDTGSNILYKRVNDGTNDIWLQIS